MESIKRAFFLTLLIFFNTPYFGVFGGASTKFASVGNYRFQI